MDFSGWDSPDFSGLRPNKKLIPKLRHCLKTPFRRSWFIVRGKSRLPPRHGFCVRLCFGRNLNLPFRQKRRVTENLPPSNFDSNKKRGLLRLRHAETSFGATPLPHRLRDMARQFSCRSLHEIRPSPRFLRWKRHPEPRAKARRLVVSP